MLVRDERADLDVGRTGPLTEVDANANADADDDADAMGAGFLLLLRADTEEAIFLFSAFTGI